MENKVVMLRSSRGEIRRIVVADFGEIVSVCREEELKQAAIEGRKPATAGFKKSDITKIL